jgi:integrase
MSAISAVTDPRGLRWRDVDLDTGTVSVRRSAGMVRNAGEGAAVTAGDTKSGKPRVVDLDAAITAVLRSWKAARRTFCRAASARPRTCSRA